MEKKPKFERCFCRQPIPHGYFYYSDRISPEPTVSVEEGYEIVDLLLEHAEDFTEEDALEVREQIKESGLPFVFESENSP